MKKMAKKAAPMKKYMTGGMANPNSKDQFMSPDKVAGKGTKSRATSSGGVNTPPAGATPGRKMSSSTTFSKSPTNQANRGLMKKGGAAKMMKKGGSTKKK